MEWNCCLPGQSPNGAIAALDETGLAGGTPQTALFFAGLGAGMEDDAPGVPEWVVTYGDMMSLLLTFFIMLVSLSEIVAEEKYRAILDSLQRYVGYRTGPVAPPGKNFPLNSLVARLESLGSYTDINKGRGGVKQEALVGTDVNVLKNREGTSLAVGLPVLFDPGEVVLSDAAKIELSGIAEQLAGKPNKIEVRAHTSNAPLPAESRFADKVVLAYERARAVLQFLTAQGIDTTRIRVSALGDIEPLQTADERGRGHLDRAEVLILDAFAEEFVGPRDDGPGSQP